MAEETIIIKPEDLVSPLKEFKEPASTELVCLDPEKNIWVKFGLPVANTSVDNSQIIIPNEPYVFFVDDLTVNDKNHNNFLMHDVTVIFAHGYRDGEIWKFLNGQSIVETVRAYDAYAKINNLPAIDFVVACNQDSQPNPLGIKVKDFSTDKLIAQSVGEAVSIYPSGKNQEGRVSLSIGVKGEFWGLDDLKTLKDIKI